MKGLEIPETAEELIRMLRQWGPGKESNLLILAFEACVDDGEEILDRLIREGRVERISDEHGLLKWIVPELSN